MTETPPMPPAAPTVADLPAAAEPAAAEPSAEAPEGGAEGGAHNDAAAILATEESRAKKSGVYGECAQFDKSKPVSELILQHHPAVEASVCFTHSTPTIVRDLAFPLFSPNAQLRLPGEEPKHIKPNKIAGKFVLFDGGALPGTPWIIYSAHASLPTAYEQPLPLPTTCSMTPVRLGSSAGIYVGIAENTMHRIITAVVYWDGSAKQRLTADVTLNRLKVDDTRTLAADEIDAAAKAMEKWILGCGTRDGVW